MVELLVVKLPDGTKDALRKLGKERGYLTISDVVRDLIRKWLLEAKE